MTVERPVLDYAHVKVGDSVTPLVRGPMTQVHLMRWSASMENWHRIHYDERFAIEHDGLPGLLINGSWKQHVLVQMMTEWLGPTGWLAKIDFRFKKMDVVGSTLTTWGTVREKYERDGLGYVRCEIGIRNQDGEESTSGSALGVLPADSDTRVPYPFPVSVDDDRN